jgi:hypothetical protein
LAGNEKLSCVSVIFLQYPNECSLESSSSEFTSMAVTFSFQDILSLFVHLKKQRESNYKSNCCCYFDVFLHLPVRILHICWGVQMKKKWWLDVDLLEESAPFWVPKLEKCFPTI